MRPSTRPSELQETDVLADDAVLTLPRPEPPGVPSQKSPACPTGELF